MTEQLLAPPAPGHTGDTAELPHIEPGEFRSLMSTFPTGVSVITTGRAGVGTWGLTCSSVASVSLDPPTLLVCLRQGSRTLEPLLRMGTFAVNLLHDQARATAELFASSAPDRFDRVDWELGPAHGGPHLVADAHAIADCRISKTVPVGDHVVVFGEIHRVIQELPDEARPLLYGMRRFTHLPAESVKRT